MVSRNGTEVGEKKGGMREDSKRGGEKTVFENSPSVRMENVWWLAVLPCRQCSFPDSWQWQNGKKKTMGLDKNNTRAQKNQTDRRVKTRRFAHHAIYLLVYFCFFFFFFYFPSLSCPTWT